MAEPSAQKLAREMTHTRSSSQDQSTQPLDGSILKALVRGWMAGTAGIPGDLEGLARMGINKALGAGGVNVDEAPALPTTDFYKQWLPGKQVGDENVAAVGSLFGGAGMGTIAKGTNKAARAVPGALTQMARNAAVPRTLSRQAGVIKVPGGNWLTGSVEDALRGLRQHQNPQDALDLAQTELARPNADPATLAAVNERLPGWQREAALNQFIDKQLTRYIKNDMATERDPIRALAERGVLHVDPEQLNFQVPMHGKYLEEGQTAVAQAPGAKAWEGASDMQIAKMNAGELLRGDNWFPDTAAISNAAERNPWLATKPDAEVVAVRDHMMAQDLGFDHLIDELRNATNPQSGLPANLLLKPESLDRVSVPQAVEHVAKINAWREAQKVAANEAIANNAATHLFKEYAENNPKGLRWVELKMPPGETKSHLTTEAGFPRYDPAGKYLRTPGGQMLQDALKYEGDTMGHCVGGYCDDVASGASRIFSLRDAKGQPHVTIETTPSRSNKIRDMQAGTPTDFNIVQIKGKANRKPKDEYLPFIQDFVRSGKWGGVGDLDNAGLYHRNQFPVIDDLDLPLPEGQTYFTAEELSKFRKVPGFAEGGAVKGPWWDSYVEEPIKVAAVPSTEAWDAAQAKFKADIVAHPERLGADGRFKGPGSGVNFMVEGLTPDEVLAAAKPSERLDIDGGAGQDYQAAARSLMLDTAWRPGPDNGGGFLGGLGRAVQGTFDGIRTNPALMAAFTAGAGGYVNSGLRSAGLSASAAKVATPLVSNAARTLIGGGSVADAAKNAVAGYIGGEVGSAAKDASGIDFLGKAANTLAQSAIKGKLSGATIDQLATQYAAGKISDLTGLPPQTVSVIVNLARSKKGSTVGPLSRAKRA